MSVPSAAQTLEPAAQPSSGDEVKTENDSADWVEHATFIVCFDRRGDDSDRQWQTRVWDTKAMAEEVVIGTDPERWVDLIVDRADLPA